MINKTIAYAAAGLLVLSSQALSAPQNEPTVLFQRDDSNTAVMSSRHNGGDVCLIAIKHREAPVMVIISMNGSGYNGLGVSDERAGSKISVSRRGTSVRVGLDVSGTRQSYNLKVTDQNFVEVELGRAAQTPLRSALQSSSGFSLLVDGAEKIEFIAQREAVSAFNNCVQSGIRDRLDQRLRDLQRQLQR